MNKTIFKARYNWPLRSSDVFDIQIRDQILSNSGIYGVRDAFSYIEATLKNVSVRHQFFPKMS